MSPAEKLADQKAKMPRDKVHGTREAKWNCCLNEMRIKLRLTMRDVQAKTGVSSAVICAIEKGTDPQLTTARKLAEFFGVSVEEMWPTRIGHELRGRNNA